MKDINNDENEINQDYKNGNEKEKLINNFIQDLPFEIYIRKESYNSNLTIFLDKNNFYKYYKNFEELVGLKSFKDTLDQANVHINNYEMFVIFNKESKYINENTFKLDYFERLG